MVANQVEPGLLVIEAPTGEGKTKAALQAVGGLARQLGLTGIYQAMPTRATSNQAFEEMSSMLRGSGSNVAPAYCTAPLRTSSPDIAVAEARECRGRRARRRAGRGRALMVREEP